jgi:D-alanyl-lipoteichoic acid acyltransferase DltB (MBOAT superfamily)
MLFNSLEFLIFLPIIFILFWFFPKKLRWLVLLAASYCFYMWWNWKLVFLILFTTIISYSCGILVEKYNSNVRLKRLSLILSLVLCFGVLFFFKYFPFLANVYSDIVKVFGGEGIHGYFDIMLPVGISFYTFQTASYVIDCYKGKIKSEKHFGYYALFVTFFPQLVAGPIERPEDLLPQLKSFGGGELINKANRLF